MRYLWLSLATLCVAGIGLLVFCVRQYENQHESAIPTTHARIVSLAPNVTEILFALGLDAEIVAVSTDSDYPAQAADRKKVGTFWQPNTEAIIASRPDLVIALWFEQQKAVADSLKRLSYRVLTLKIEKIEELFAAITEIGTVTGCQQRARGLVTDIKSRIEQIKPNFASANKTKVLWVIQTEPLRVAGRNTFINEVVELAGGQNAIGPTIQQYPQIGTEELLVCGAEVIIQSAMSTSDIVEQQNAAEAYWTKRVNLPAVRNGRIHVVNPDTVLRLGPRLPRGVEMVARYLHPGFLEQTHGSLQEIKK